MKGLTHIREQCYKYDSEEDLKKIDIDGYPKYYIDQENKVVRYEFDLSHCVRLDILLKAIRTIRLRGGQLLLLINKIIDHCDYIKSHNSTHLNLQSENVWLVLQQDSEHFKIIYRDKLNYQIYFTGYGYDQESQVSDPNFICKQVLIEIINNLDQCYEKSLLAINAQLFNIKQKLLERIQIDTQKQFKEQIDKILKQFNCSFQSQLLQGLDVDRINLLRPQMQGLFESYLTQLSNIVCKNQNECQEKYLQQLCCQLNAEYYLSNYYLPQVRTALSQNLSTADIQNKIPIKYKQLEVEQAFGYYFEQFYKQYWQLTQKMNEALKQEFKIADCLSEEELKNIIKQEIDHYIFQAVNSSKSADLYLSKQYPFSQWTHNNIKRRIKEQHKNNFIKFVDDLVKSLQ